MMRVRRRWFFKRRCTRRESARREEKEGEGCKQQFVALLISFWQQYEVVYLERKKKAISVC